MVVMTRSGEIEKAKIRKKGVIGEEVSYVPARSIQFSTVYQNKTYSVPLALAMVILLMIPIVPFLSTERVYGTVSFDVNPSVELTVNDSYDVIATNGFNKEGREVLNNIDDKLIGESLNSAATLLIEKSEELGYLSSSEIYLSSQLSLSNQDMWGEDYEQWVSSINEKYSVQFISIFLDDDIINEAKEYSISPTKFLLLKEAEKKGIDIDSSELNNLTVNEIETSIGELVENVVPENKINMNSSNNHNPPNEEKEEQKPTSTNELSEPLKIKGTKKEDAPSQRNDEMNQREKPKDNIKDEEHPSVNKSNNRNERANEAPGQNKKNNNQNENATRHSQNEKNNRENNQQNNQQNDSKSHKEKSDDHPSSNNQGRGNGQSD